MKWVDASSITAQVVKAKSAGDRPDNHLVDGSVNNAHTAGASSLATDSTLGITTGLEASEPLPAAIGDLHL